MVDGEGFLKVKIGDEEKSFESQDAVVEYIQSREQTAMDLQRQLEEVKGGLDGVEDLRRLEKFLNAVPQGKDMLRELWEKTHGGTVPLDEAPAPRATSPAAAPGADDVSQILAKMDAADDFDGIKEVFKSAFTRVNTELQASRSELREIQNRIVPAVAAMSEREQGSMIVDQYYRTMESFQKDPRFKDLGDRDWALIDKHLTMADVSPDQFKAAFEDEATTMLDYRNEIAASMGRRGGVRNLGDLPGPLPFPVGGSAQMGSQGGNNPTPKDRDEWKQRMAAALLGETLGGTEGP